MLKQVNLAPSLYIVIFTLGWSLFGCNNLVNTPSFVSVTTTNDKHVHNKLPKVVATTTIICDLVSKITGRTINLNCLIPPNTDPHTYQLSNADQQAINQADLIFYNGYSLETQIIKAIRTTQNRSPKVAVAKFAVKKPLYFINKGHQSPNPHVWHNVGYAVRMIAVINSFLGQKFPQNKYIYQKNANTLKSELFQLDTWITNRVKSIPKHKRKLITVHNSMSYYAKKYNFNLSGSLYNSSRISQPYSNHLQTLAKSIIKAKVFTIFPEFTINTELIIKVARQAGVKIANKKLYTDALSNPGSEADTYQKMMTTNTRTIIEALGGTYLIFTPN
ncbi:Periplasmic solute binding protein [Richelia intracellularis HH01]|uniref:Periplasmic solute binding protein n=1 Tax=Richelia intracellularis HH01 TaxID=1165094 RepID=M1WZM7_9NOST|nr:zinc ABC transporter substrate-binding protein [Richelia intracellularis]CCH66953.1 Periplasmic solute binding protein [Richelia intracellularis HH01]